MNADRTPRAGSDSPVHRVFSGCFFRGPGIALALLCLTLLNVGSLLPGVTVAQDFISVRDALHRAEARGKIPATSEEPVGQPYDEPYDVDHYWLDIAFAIPDRDIEGTVGIRAESCQDGLQEIFVHVVSLTIDAVRMDGDTLTWQSKIGGIEIDLGEVYDTGEKFTIQIDYHGSPTAGYYADRFRDCWWTATEPSDSRYWFPCHDLPADKAPADLRFTVPIGYIVASNGVFEGVDRDPGEGTDTYTWKEVHPVATYLISVAISHYALIRDSYGEMDIVHFVYPSDSLAALEDFKNTPQMMECFEGLFVDYPFDKYGHAEAPIFDGWGAMEHQTCTTWGHNLITGSGTYEAIVAHELAHQWWGDLVTCGTWKDIWLNEGFATFSEALWYEHLHGEEYYHQYMDELREYYFDYEGYEGRFPLYDPDYMWGGTVYEKGAWVVHMLRYILGDDAFFDALGSWATTYAFESVVTAQLQETMESAHGETLEWFFQQWVYEPGYPEYLWSWQSMESGGEHVVTVFLEQTQQDAPVFAMPVEFQFLGDGLDTTMAAWIDAREDSFSIALPVAVTEVLFDPDSWILKKIEKTGVMKGSLEAAAGENHVRLSWDMDGNGCDLRDVVCVICRCDQGANPSSETIVATFPGEERMGECHDDTGDSRGDVRYDLKACDGGGGEYLLDSVVLSRPRPNPSAHLALAISPNPFNPHTQIRWTIPPGRERVPVAVRIFNIRGEKVRTLAIGTFSAGEYSRLWNGRDDRGRPLPGGVYTCVISAGGENRARKLILLK